MSASSIELFAIGKTEELIDTAVFALHDALRLREPDAVHRMRVSLRRLEQALRVFEQYLKKSGVKRVRKHVKKALRVAGAFRNYDIALGLVEKDGNDIQALRAARSAAQKEFRATLKEITQKDLGVNWRMSLGLPA